MGELADRLDSLDVRASSPDGRIHASVLGSGRSIEVSFDPDSYQWYAEPMLGYQLAQLATLTFVRFRRDQQESMALVYGQSIADDGIEFGPERRRYREKLAQVVSTGHSPDGATRVTSRAMVSWTFDIAAGTVRAVPERQFLSGLQAAVDDVIRDYRVQSFILRDEVYDGGYPTWLREAMGLPGRGSGGSGR